MQVVLTETHSGILPAGISLAALPLTSSNTDMGGLLEGGKVTRWNPDKAGDNMSSTLTLTPALPKGRWLLGETGQDDTCDCDRAQTGSIAFRHPTSS